MSSDKIERKINEIRTRLKKRKIWNLGYLEEMARNQAQLMVNEWSNTGRDYPLVKFLLERGFTPDNIVAEAKNTRDTVRNHQTYLAKINSQQEKKNRKHKKHKHRKHRKHDSKH